MTRIVWMLAGAFALAACTEKPQTAASRKADDKPWELAQPGFRVGGFKPADAAAWDAQLKARAQAQNEYNRTVPR